MSLSNKQPQAHQSSSEQFDEKQNNCDSANASLTEEQKKQQFKDQDQSSGQQANPLPADPKNGKYSFLTGKSKGVDKSKHVKDIRSFDQGAGKLRLEVFMGPAKLKSQYINIFASGEEECAKAGETNFTTAFGCCNSKQHLLTLRHELSLISQVKKQQQVQLQSMLDAKLRKLKISQDAATRFQLLKNSSQLSQQLQSIQLAAQQQKQNGLSNSMFEQTLNKQVEMQLIQEMAQANEKSQENSEDFNYVTISEDANIGTEQFIIQYKPDMNHFLFRDMQSYTNGGSGSFIRVQKQRVLQLGQIIFVGESAFVVAFLQQRIKQPLNKSQENAALVNLPYMGANGDLNKQILAQHFMPKIMIKFLKGEQQGNKLLYEKDEVPILMGRDSNNQVVFRNAKNMSRVQCRIDYINDDWILKDGDGKKPSTNGTWIYAQEQEILQDGDQIKAGNSLFKISLQPSLMS